MHFGRLQGPAGFGRTVALKRLHSHLASDPFFGSLLKAEARLAARVHHPNVVPLLDVVSLETGEIILVMDYVHGETLGALLGASLRRGQRIPIRVAVAVMSGALIGLHAAHEAKSEGGVPLRLVHGDVSPHNVIVGVDGAARILDFGVARAGDAAAQPGRVIGTPAYMAPERLRGEPFDRRSDIFGAGVILWEMLVLERLFSSRGESALIERRDRKIPPPSKKNASVPAALDQVVARALHPVASERFATAREFARALEAACAPAQDREVAEWIGITAGHHLSERAYELARIEQVTGPDRETIPSTHTTAVVEPSPIPAALAAQGERPSRSMPRSVPARLSLGQTPPPAAFASRSSATGRPAEPRDLDRADQVLVGASGAARLGLAEPIAGAVGRASIKPSQELTVVDDDATEVDQRTRFGRPLGSVRVPDPRRRAGVRRPTPRSLPTSLDVTHPVSPTLSPAVAALSRDVVSFAAPAGDAPPTYRTNPEAVPDTGHFRSSTGSISERSTVPPAPPGRSGWSLPTSHVLRTREIKRRVRRGLAITAAAGVAMVGFRLLVPSVGGPEPAAPPISAARASHDQFAPPIPAPIPAALPARINVPTVPVEAAVPAQAAAPATSPDVPAAVLSPPSEAPPVPAAKPPLERKAPQLKTVALERHSAPGRQSRPPSHAKRQGIPAVVALNRDALAAYEQLDLQESLELLQRAVRLCEDEGPSARPSLATTHLHLGIVLAAGFKQRDLGAKHFRLATELRPGIAPLPSQMSPDVLAALRLARGVPVAPVETGGSDDPLAGAP